MPISYTMAWVVSCLEIAKLQSLGNSKVYITSRKQQYFPPGKNVDIRGGEKCSKNRSSLTILDIKYPQNILLTTQVQSPHSWQLVK